MIIVKSKNNVSIRLTVERWSHITKRHPEMIDQKERVLETIAKPDMIQKGDYGEFLSVKYYEPTPLGSKFLIVAHKEISELDGFIVTAYFTNKPSDRREVIWKR